MEEGKNDLSMNRRKFCKVILGGTAAAFFLPGILLEDKIKKAAAAVSKKKILIPQVKIRETYLKFGYLENRLSTDAIVIHHIGNTNADVSAATVHRWHLNNGWSGIGYHYIIRKNGVIERGRPRDTVGAHCYGYNDCTVGINVVGEFDSAVPTKAQMTSLTKLLAALCQLYQLYPTEDVIFGHRDFCNTACPGDNLYARLPLIRKETKALLN